MRRFVPGSDEEGGGRWVQHRPVPQQWELSRDGVRFNASLTPFRHLGFFPDMAPQWDWMRSARERRRGAQPVRLHRRWQPAAERSGRAAGPCRRFEEVGRAGQGECDGFPAFDDRPIRWMVDDASKFTAREVRRGRRYDGILLDPPKFGRGPDW